LKPVALVKTNGGVHARRGIEVEPLVAGFCGESFKRVEQFFGDAAPSMNGPHIHAFDFAAALNFRKFAEGNASDYIIFLRGEPDAAAFCKIIVLEFLFRVACNDVRCIVILFDDAKCGVHIRQVSLSNGMASDCFCSHAHSMRARKGPKSSKLARFCLTTLGLADLMNARNYAAGITSDVEFAELIVTDCGDVTGCDRKERSARQC